MEIFTKFCFVIPKNNKCIFMNNIVTIYFLKYLHYEKKLINHESNFNLCTVKLLTITEIVFKNNQQ